MSDLDASRRFYELALGGITPVDSEHALTRCLHVGFGVENRDSVDRWWERMTAAGYRSDGEPGERPQYNSTYYGGFVLDPDGNSVEAVHHQRSRTGQLDHVWLRTGDLEGSKRFYETIATAVGIYLGRDEPERVGFSDGAGSFTFVPGNEPTEHVHLAFGVPSAEAVTTFHETATRAGYENNGAPGERPNYHPGYYAAFVLDPNGHNVEAVFHDRRSASSG